MKTTKKMKLKETDALIAMYEKEDDEIDEQTIITYENLDPEQAEILDKHDTNQQMIIRLLEIKVELLEAMIKEVA